MTEQHRDVWSGEYKIPWGEPGFSRRMLAEHLSQNHDLASRREEWIDKQAAWIHTDLLGGRISRVLDLGCGPGLYTRRMVNMGYSCTGIDIGPESIKYAQQHNDEPARCRFVCDDIRMAEFGGPHDLVMLLYGEMNVFSPAEIRSVIARSHDSLAPRGLIIVEAQTQDAVKSTGVLEPTEQVQETGLFADYPHRCVTESAWLEDDSVAVQTFTVTNTADGTSLTYRNTTRSWSDNEIRELLRSGGFANVSNNDTWPCNSESLKLWIASKA